MSRPGAPDDGRAPAASLGRLAAVLAVTGVCAGVAGGGLTLLLHVVQHAAYGYTESTFGVGVQHASGRRRVLAMVAAGLVAGAGWWLVRRRGAVPTVAAAVEGRAPRLPPGQVGADAVLQILVVGLGGSLGREGAPRQLGAAAGGWLAERAGLGEAQRRLVLGCGAGAGLAAVYNVPLGGALFALEVVLRTARPPAAAAAALAAGVATVTAWTVLPDRPTYHLAAVTLSGAVVVWSVLAGPLLGLAGTGFRRLTGWAAEHRPAGWRLPVATLAVFPALGGLAVGYPQLLGNGRGPAQLAFDGSLSVGTLATLAVLKPLATAACLGSGAAGGRLTPAVATGALLGVLAGSPWTLLWPGVPARAFALVAAAAFLAVALEAPVTAAVLLLELTGTGTALILPVVLAVGGATVAGRAVTGRPVCGRGGRRATGRP